MADDDGRESTLGCIFLSNEIWYIGRVLNNWSLQILEVEYIVAYEIAKEAFWSVTELGIISWVDTTLFFDNIGAIALAKELKSHQNF